MKKIKYNGEKLASYPYGKFAFSIIGGEKAKKK
jgi:hypothetical protein